MTKNFFDDNLASAGQMRVVNHSCNSMSSPKSKIDKKVKISTKKKKRSLVDPCTIFQNFLFIKYVEGVIFHHVNLIKKLQGKIDNQNYHLKNERKGKSLWSEIVYNSPYPLKKTMGVCVWELTSPGMSTWFSSKWTSSAAAYKSVASA